MNRKLPNILIWVFLIIVFIACFIFGIMFADTNAGIILPYFWEKFARAYFLVFLIGAIAGSLIWRIIFNKRNKS